MSACNGFAVLEMGLVCAPQVAVTAAVRVVMMLIRTVSRTDHNVLWEVFETLNDVLLTLEPLVTL